MLRELENFSEPLSILIIEDNQGDFILIEDYLIEKFKLINIAHFRDFKSAVSYLEDDKNNVSAVLLDLNLPDKEGMELINGILSYNFQLPIIILTGYSDLAMAKYSLQLGISDYLIKDEINPVVLHKTISFALNRSSFIRHIESEKFNYENLFNFSPQPTWLLDNKSLKILNANLAAKKEYGYSTEEFLNKSFLELHPENEHELIRKKLNSESEEYTRFEFTHYLNCGKEIKVDIYAKAISSDSASGLIVQSNDITQTLERIRTIESQNAKLKEIAWMQSHVVRAPLCRIMGIINLIEEESGSLEDLHFWLKQLRTSTNEMDEIVKKIVDQTNLFEKE